MNWTDGPATWKQLRYLSHHGYKADHMLTKAEASDLIKKFGGNPEDFTIVTEPDRHENAQEQTAYQLRLAIEKARQAMGRVELERHQNEITAAITKRQDFWLDTCRGPGNLIVSSRQAQDFYQKFGCRFVAPTRKQVQYILDALDSAMPLWDKDHPGLFYQTLELNFRELLRPR